VKGNFGQNLHPAVLAEVLQDFLPFAGTVGQFPAGTFRVPAENIILYPVKYF
jgi:hypothetical protein